MPHIFTFNRRRFCFDTESGTFIELSPAAYALAAGLPTEKFKESELAAARAELENLEAAGLFNAPPQQPVTTKPSGIIKALCLHISHDCNLACSYCFADGGKYKGERRNMSIDTARRAVDFLIKNSGGRKNLEIDFFGGEPLLNFGAVKDTVEYAKSEAAKCGKSFKFTLTTNALLLTDEVIEYLDKETDNVVISLDGRSSVHDKTRKTAGGRGSFDIAFANAKKFAAAREKSKKDYYIRGTFTAENLDFAADAEFLFKHFKRVSLEPVTLPPAHPLALREEHADKLCAEYEKLAEWYVKAKRRDPSLVFFHFMLDLTAAPCLDKRIRACGAGTEYAAISPEGGIFPCHQFVGSPLSLGSLADGKLDRKTVSRFAEATLFNKDDCPDCFAKYHCGGGCNANSFNISGGFRAHDKLSCVLMRKRLECALYAYGNL